MEKYNLKLMALVFAAAVGLYFFIPGLLSEKLVPEISAANGVITNICGGPNDINGIGKGRGSCGRCTNVNGTNGNCRAQAGEVLVVVECGARLDTNTHNWGIECQGTQLGVHTQTFNAGRRVNIKDYLKDNCIVQIDVFKEGKVFAPTSEGGLVDFIVMYNPSCGGSTQPPAYTSVPEPTPQTPTNPDLQQPTTPVQETCLPGQKYYRTGAVDNEGQYICNCEDPGISNNTGRGYSTVQPGTNRCIELSPDLARGKGSCDQASQGIRCYTDGVFVNGIQLGSAIYVEPGQGQTSVCQSFQSGGGSNNNNQGNYYSFVNQAGTCNVTNNMPDQCAGKSKGSKCNENVTANSAYYVEYRGDSVQVCDCYRRNLNNTLLDQCLTSAMNAASSSTGSSSSSSSNNNSNNNRTYYNSKLECTNRPQNNTPPPANNQCPSGERLLFYGTMGPNGFTCAVAEGAACRPLYEGQVSELDRNGYVVNIANGTTYYYFANLDKCTSFTPPSTTPTVNVPVEIYSMVGDELRTPSLNNPNPFDNNCDIRESSDLSSQCKRDVKSSGKTPQMARCTDIDVNDLGIPNIPAIDADVWLENPAFGVLRNCCQQKRDNEIGGAAKREFGLTASNCKQYLQERIRAYELIGGSCQFKSYDEVTEDQVNRLNVDGQVQHIDAITKQIITIYKNADCRPFAASQRENNLAKSLAKRALAEISPNSEGKLIANTSGRYTVNLGQASIAELELVVGDKDVEIKLYNDANGNGVKDPQEKYLTAQEAGLYKLGLAQDTTVENYNLNAGWNLIHLPVVDNRQDNPVKSASSLVYHWNKQGVEITNVAMFTDGRFRIYTQRGSGQNYSPDFDLIPGKGIFVYNNTRNRQVTFSGKKLTSPAPLVLNNGWNLIGLATPKKQYNSEQFLKAVKSEDINASTISQFENGLYQSVVYEDNLVYGNNFNLVEKRGYFVKLESGGGKQWKNY